MKDVLRALKKGDDILQSSFSHHYLSYVCLAPCFSNWLHENGNVVISCRFCHATHLPQGVFGAAVGVFDNKVHRC